MVKVKEDLAGRIFGRLTVIEQADDYIDKNGRHLAQWLCECSCENKTKKVVQGHSLKRGYTKSCGCLPKERMLDAAVLRHKANKYDLSGTYGIGWTSNTNQEFYFDIEDYDIIKDYYWHEVINCKSGYHVLRAYSIQLKKHIYMHQLITGQKDMDHENQNPLDNRKENLRNATRSQQGANRPKQSNNTSGFIGVRWYKSTEQWRAEITVNKKCIYLGNFYNKEDAIKVRLQAEAKYFVVFAPQRHLFEQYGINIGDDSDEKN